MSCINHDLQKIRVPVDQIDLLTEIASRVFLESARHVPFT